MPERPAPPRWPADGERHEPDTEFDASDLHAVNHLLNRCRARLFRTSTALSAAQREAVTADLAYRHAMRRALVSTSGGTAETRKATAELQCEAEETAAVVARQVADEFRQRAQDARDDLKAAENLAHNARAQMSVR